MNVNTSSSFLAFLLHFLLICNKIKNEKNKKSKNKKKKDKKTQKTFLKQITKKDKKPQRTSSIISIKLQFRKIFKNKNQYLFQTVSKKRRGGKDVSK